MKPSNQSYKVGTSNSKIKKNFKEKEKRKGGTPEANNHNVTEKGSPTKESNTRLYAGIDGDSIINYAEQTAIEHLSEDITNTLTEDINYKLRYIINESLIKGRLSGRNAISSSDIEQTFDNLKLSKVYGAPSHPNWIIFSDQSLVCLDDNEVNLIEMAQAENVYYQYSDITVTAKWLPEQEISKSLKNYFTTMCQMIVNSDVETRRMALINISENPRVGPIVEWFYNFGYILLSKDITYDCLTLRALDLITVLENSHMCRINVSEKQLRLIVRLVLQRLLKSTTTHEVLKPICNVLALLCNRDPLRQFVLVKILQKFDEVFPKCAASIVAIANSLGTDGIRKIILPKLELFLNVAFESRDPRVIYFLMESYYILCQNNLTDAVLYGSFFEYFGDAMLIFNSQCNVKSKSILKRDINFICVKSDLLRHRRQITPREKVAKVNIDEVFDLPPDNSRIRKKMNEENRNAASCSETSVIIGKTTLLLPVFQCKFKNYPKCHDHTLLNYNL